MLVITPLFAALLAWGAAALFESRKKGTGS
jgi:hypothetical protein